MIVRNETFNYRDSLANLFERRFLFHKRILILTPTCQPFIVLEMTGSSSEWKWVTEPGYITASAFIPIIPSRAWPLVTVSRVPAARWVSASRGSGDGTWPSSGQRRKCNKSDHYIASRIKVGILYTSYTRVRVRVQRVFQLQSQSKHLWQF